MKTAFKILFVMLTIGCVLSTAIAIDSNNKLKSIDYCYSKYSDEIDSFCENEYHSEFDMESGVCK